MLDLNICTGIIPENMNTSSDYQRMYMQFAMTLAEKGWGQTGINPLVGAVIVKNDRILGTGYHRRIGEAHAEVVAIAEAGTDARGADLYVNLEPCCTYGKTPPCVEGIIRAGIKRVFIAETDPNPAVDGRSVEILRNNNIQVTCIPPPDRSPDINIWYRKYITTRIPYVILKIAFTSNFRISGFDSKYVTAETARRYVHAIRSRVGAVLVGANTVLTDDPFLTDRLIRRHNPTRIILDPELKIPLNAKVLAPDARRIVFVQPNMDPERTNSLQESGVELVQLDGNISPSAEILRKIGVLKIGSILVEGGGKTFSQFLQEKTYDEIYIFVAPVKVDSGIEIPLARSIVEKNKSECIGEDLLYHVYRDN